MKYIIPILPIFNEKNVKEFHHDFLGFDVDRQNGM
jgi:hypothetical protein